jgi:hypothetical protein
LNTTLTGSGRFGVFSTGLLETESEFRRKAMFSGSDMLTQYIQHAMVNPAITHSRIGYFLI